MEDFETLGKKRPDLLGGGKAPVGLFQVHQPSGRHNAGKNGETMAVTLTRLKLRFERVLDMMTVNGTNEMAEMNECHREKEKGHGQTGDRRPAFIPHFIVIHL